MTVKEAQAHFTGPAFLPWNRMGNLNRWAGPLPLSWMERDRMLQRRIVRRMRALGMSPVAPAFAGIVPRRITELFPEVPHARLPTWGHFDEKYSGSSLLNMTHPLARDIGRAFLKEYAAEFGPFRFFAVDTFNEMRPPSGDTAYLRSHAAAVREMLDSHDPRSIWVMQGWLFLDEQYWNVGRARALLTSVPRGKILVLDLASTTR